MLLLVLVRLLMWILGPEPMLFQEQKMLSTEPLAAAPFMSTFEKCLCMPFVHFTRIFLF